MEAIQAGTANRKGAAAVTSIDPEELISADEVAEMLHIRPQSLAVWRTGKRGPAWVKVGRHVFYRRADVGAWLAAQLTGGDAA